MAKGAIDGFKVVGQQHEVGQPSRPRYARDRIRPCRTGRHKRCQGLDRFRGADALIRSHEAAAWEMRLTAAWMESSAVTGNTEVSTWRRRGRPILTAEPAGSSLCGAAGAKIGVVVAVAHTSICRTKKWERMAGLHAAELSVRGHLRMNKNVMQIRAGQGTLHPIIGLQGGFDGAASPLVWTAIWNACGMIVHDKVAELFRRADQLAAVTGAGVVVFKPRLRCSLGWNHP